VRIPLDYYRILGVPVQANDEQLSQAYHDRSLQLPRREYSELAIAARKQLLDEAYKVLSDPEKRAEYNIKFLERPCEIKSLPSDLQTYNKTAKSKEPAADRCIPSIEIHPNQFIGSLLILLELGEYELAIGLGNTYLNDIQNVASKPDTLEDYQNPQILKADTILILALARLELSREHWQQGEYENAAVCGQKGLDLLVQENLFPTTQEEIQTDLYKLRPYRILELLSQSEENSPKRNKGLHLLKEMLQDRGGIDGTGEDKSGLSVDECLRFIQQLRSYLSAQEQQELFEAESQRPSAVATYLAVYALLARGFAQKKPALIIQARQTLKRLSKCQDVYLEQAVCSLLLGQTEEASLALEKSQESEPLVFIREHSQASPDLLPGLCLYGERWLRTEVFSHFSDLANQQTSLKEYFADPEVQSYLEHLPEEISIVQTPSLETAYEREKEITAAKTKARINNSFQKKKAKEIKEPAQSFRMGNNSFRSLVSQSNSSTATAEAALVTASSVGSSAAVSTLTDKNSKLSNSAIAKSLVTNSSVQPTTKQHSRKQRLKELREQIAKSPALSEPQRQNLPTPTKTRPNKRRKQSYKKNSVLLGIPLFIGLGVLGFAAQRVQIASSWLSKSKPEEELIVQLDRPLIEIPSKPNTEPLKPQKPEILSQESATKVIEAWLKSKSDAFGSDRKIDSLNTILTEPLLSQWRNQAEQMKRINAHREYEHTLKIHSVKTNEQKPLQATVEAEVREVAKHHQGGKLNSANSYDDKLLVRYDLVRQQERWLIKEVHVVN
jgi:curved DNA-binding protein CbpA